MHISSLNLHWLIYSVREYVIKLFANSANLDKTDEQSILFIHALAVQKYSINMVAGF